MAIGTTETANFKDAGTTLGLDQVFERLYLSFQTSDQIIREAVRYFFYVDMKGILPMLTAFDILGECNIANGVRKSDEPHKPQLRWQSPHY